MFHIFSAAATICGLDLHNIDQRRTEIKEHGEMVNGSVREPVKDAKIEVSK